MKKRVYYGQDQWLQWIYECAESGMTIKDWCEERGLEPSIFFRWRKRLLDRGVISAYPQTKTTTVASLQPAVVAVNLTDLTSESTSTPIRQSIAPIQSILETQIMIETPRNGCRVYVGSDFSQDTLRRVMEVIG